MADKKGKKPKKKQRRSILPRIDVIVAALYWFLRIILLFSFALMVLELWAKLKG